jgi:PAS domain S-box-containing protein
LRFASPTRDHSVVTSPAIGGDLRDTLENVNVPSYIIDSSGVIRWVNQAALRVVGDCRGRQFTSVVAPEETRRAREAFAQKVVGTAIVTDAPVVLLGADGERIAVEVSSVPLVEGHRVVGVFGQLPHVNVEDVPPPRPHLTPRQAEVLRLLEHGKSTDQIAAELHLSTETVRNHVRHLLRALGVRSRLEAVAVARRDHITT